MVDNSIHTFENYLKSKNLKLTWQRQAVVRAFVSRKGHIGAEGLYRKVQKKNPDIGFTTVYRTLNLLVDAGIATASTFRGNSAKFELTDKKEHHDHLICTECGAIVEFTNNQIEKLQEEIAEQHGFKLTEHTLEIFGVCSKCRK